MMPTFQPCSKFWEKIRRWSTADARHRRTDGKSITSVERIT